MEKPKNSEAFLYAIDNFSASKLKKIGFCRWEEESELLLIPGEFYDLIPDGLKIIDIWGKEKNFEKGISDNDTRFGCLPYGIMPKVN